jgi:hypothetical protein
MAGRYLLRRRLRRCGSRLPCPGVWVIPEPARQHGLQAPRRINLSAVTAPAEPPATHKYASEAKPGEATGQPPRRCCRDSS